MTSLFSVATINDSVLFSFDPGKDGVKRIKHGVSLSLATELDWNSALVWIDNRFDYDELRMIALAPNASTLYYVSYVDRGHQRRIISLRPATRREVKHYVDQIQETRNSHAHGGRGSRNPKGGKGRS